MKESNQTKRKAKKEVNWPTQQYFTLQQLLDINAGFKKITLTVRLSNAVEDGKFIEIGTVQSIPSVLGRPPKVYAAAPLSKSVLMKAESDGVRIENMDKLIHAINVSTPSPTPAKTPVKTAA